MSEERVGAALKVATQKARLIDLDWLKIVDTSKISIEDDGVTVKGADELMSQLKEVKPYLFSKSASEMTPEEAAAALAELRRGPKPEPPAPIPVDRHARDMSPEERAEWLRGHARRFG